MNLTKTSIAAILLSTSATSQAVELDILNWDSVEVSVHHAFVTRHHSAESRAILNESNPNIGIEINDIQVTYVSKNSFDKTSFYVAWTPDYQITDNLEISAMIGFATGYKNGQVYRSTWKENYGDSKKGQKGYYKFESEMSVGNITPLVGAALSYEVVDGLKLAAVVNPSVLNFAVSYTF